MKTGIIMEIRGKKAVVLKASGEFITVRAKKGWEKGDIVSVPQVHLPIRALSSVAAVLVLVVGLSVFGYQLLFRQVALISLDVNPSLEIGINRLDRVVSVTAYNDDGMKAVDAVEIKNEQLSVALQNLLSGDMDSYLEKATNITYTVYAQSTEKEKGLMDLLRDKTQAYLTAHHLGTELQVYQVDRTQVESAHGCHTTAGKYLAVLELQQLVPEIDVEEYCHHSYGTILSEIESHHGASPALDPSETTGGEGEDSGHHAEDGADAEAGEHHAEEDVDAEAGVHHAEEDTDAGTGEHHAEEDVEAGTVEHHAEEDVDAGAGGYYAGDDTGAEAGGYYAEDDADAVDDGHHAEAGGHE